MMECAGIAFGILALLGPVQETLVYGAPDSAGSEDLAKAAQAMAARCKSYGYKGILAVPIEEEGRTGIQVISDTGFTPEMKRMLDGFAQLSCSSVEIRFRRPLTEIEKEQYQPGADPSQDKAPSGVRWFRFRGSEEEPVLLRDFPVIVKSEILSRQARVKSGAMQRSWEVNGLKTRELLELEKKGRLGTPYLIIDGGVIEALALTTFKTNEEGKRVAAERAGFSPSLRWVREALSWPMPFCLRGGCE